MSDIDNPFFVPIQICFNFKQKGPEEAFNQILNELQNIGLSPIGTKRGYFEKYYILWYSLKVPQLPFKGYKKYTNINRKYSKLLTEISIIEAKEFTIDWIGDEIRVISKHHLDKLFGLILNSIDSIYLDSILSGAILGYKDSIMTDEIMDSIGLVDNLKDFRKLFEEKLMGLKDVKRIFHLIDTNDFILIKQLFQLIIQKSDLGQEELYDLYYKIKGKVPFKRELLGYIWIDELADEKSKLEMFFKKYIYLEKICIDVIEKEAKSTLKDIKIQIPLDSKAYNFEKKYPGPVAKILLNLFKNQASLTLDIFEMVLSYELKKLNAKIKGLRVSFSFSDSKESIQKLRDEGYYFDELKELYNNKLGDYRNAKRSGEINEFVIFHGYCIKSRNQIYNWIKRFYIRDQNRHRIGCQVNQNRSYFNSLPLEMESELIIQASLIVKYKYNKKFRDAAITEKYLDIIDIQIIDNFENVEYNLGHSRGREKILVNNKEGIKIYTHSLKTGGVLGEKPVSSKPIQLLNVFFDKEDEKKEKFYEIKVNGDVISEKFDGLIEHLYDELLVDNEGVIKTSIRQIVKKSKKQFRLNPKPMYRTAGIFLNENNELELVYEDHNEIRIIPETDIQTEFLEITKSKELDRHGKLTENYLKIINLPTIPENARLSALGFGAINPFFDAASDKFKMLPLLLFWGDTTTGKSQTLCTFVTDPFGNPLRNADDIDSASRYTLFLTANTFAVNFDDLDKLSDKLVGFTKSYCTKRGKRYRNTPGQKMITNRMYANICGSFNKREFITRIDDEAFNLRCIIHHLKDSLKDRPDLRPYFKEFELHENKISESNLLFGYYILEKALEYFDSLYSEKLTNYQKLLKLYKEVREKLSVAIRKRNIVIDIRRIRIIAVIYIGWEIWDYVFQTKGFKCELLKKALNLDSETFYNYVLEIENAEKEINEEVFEMIFEFFFQNRIKYFNYRRCSKDPSLNNQWVITGEFVADYDHWARMRGYQPIKSLATLANILSKLSNEKIERQRIHYENRNKLYKNDYFKGRNWAIYVPLGDFLKLRYRDLGMKEITELAERIIIKDDETTGKIDMDKIFRGPLGLEFEKTVVLVDRLKEVFEENEWQEIELSGIIQVLNLEDKLTPNFINEIIKEFIKDGTLIENNGKVLMKRESKGVEYGKKIEFCNDIRELE